MLAGWVLAIAGWDQDGHEAELMAVGVALPFSPLGRYLKFIPLPSAYWPFLALTLACYLLLTQGVKILLLRRHWI